MCSERVRLISSIIAASVVDLPEPVGPVTRTRPRGYSARLCSDVREAELLERLDLLRDQPEGRADSLALVVDVDAEARDARHRVREVELALQLEVLLLLAREDPVQERTRVVRGERLEALSARNVPAHAERRRASDRDMQVGGAERDHLLEQVVDGGELFALSLDRAIGTALQRLESRDRHSPWGMRIAA